MAARRTSRGRATQVQEPEAQAGEAESILKKLSGSKGICAVLGDRKAELTLQLARKSEFIFYIQLRNGADVLAAREAADAAGFYGRRIYVEQGDPSLRQLPDLLPADEIPEKMKARPRKDGLIAVPSSDKLIETPLSHWRVHCHETSFQRQDLGSADSSAT